MTREEGNRLRRGQRLSLGNATLFVVAGLVLVYMIFPIVIVIPLSFSSAEYLRFPPPGLSLRWYETLLGRPDWIAAAWLSTWVALVVTLISIALGTLASFGLIRGKFPGRKLISGVVISPIVIPVIIIAIGVYFTYARLGLVRGAVGLILAHTCLATPFVVTTVMTTLVGFDRRLEYAAMILGANPLRTFYQVTFPIIRPGILTGALFAFLTSFDDLVIALFVAGSSTTTLPLKIWADVRYQIEPTIAAVSSLLIVFTAGLLLAAELLRRRSERLRTNTGQR